MRRRAVAAFCLGVALLAGPGGHAADPPRCTRMALPEAGVGPPPTQYTDFCGREPAACALDGASVIDWTPALHARLEAVNRAVNAGIRFVPDIDSTGFEEVWSFPDKGRGDCEDYALEKRRRLVAGGLPGAALTCAIAYHEVEFSLHAVLTVETTAGTWLLDSLHDEVLCWDAVPYVFTSRERPDGQWTRLAPP